MARNQRKSYYSPGATHPPRMVDEAQGLLVFSDGTLMRVVRQRGGGGGVLEGRYEFRRVSRVKLRGWQRRALRRGEPIVGPHTRGQRPTKRLPSQDEGRSIPVPESGAIPQTVA